jgi:hypothetical protein
LELDCINDDTVVAGQPIVFVLTLKNTGSRPVNLPRNPFIGMKWRYASGWSDGHLPPDQPPVVEDRNRLITLAPGESIEVTKKIKTNHFPAMNGGIGISEFRAAYNSMNNVQSNSFPLWEGVLVSNTYGVEVVKERRR